MLKSTGKYGHLKYTVQLADIVALGASLTGTITLDTLPAGAIVRGAYVKATAALTGGTIATAVAQVVLNAATFGSTTSVFTVAAEPTNVLQGNAGLAGTVSSANTLGLALTTTVGNLNAATSGQIDVVIDYSVLNS